MLRFKLKLRARVKNILGLVLIVVASFFSVNAFAGKQGAGELVVDYLYHIRASFATCYLDAQSAILVGEILGSQDFNFDKIPPCRKNQGLEVTQRLKRVQAMAKNNRPLAVEVSKLQRYWSVAMMSYLLPARGDSIYRYKGKADQASQTLKEMGNRVLSVYCKDDFACIEENGEKLSKLDGVT